MRCLSIRNPWAWFVIKGHKRVENRSRPTNHRGLLAIHAGLADDGTWEPGVVHANGSWDGEFLPDGTPWPAASALPRGVILGTVEVIDCVLGADAAMAKHFRTDPSQEYFADEDAWCWILANPQALAKPVPWRGQQGLWDVADEVLRETVRA